MSLWAIREIFQPKPDSLGLVDKETSEATGCVGFVLLGEENYPVAEGEFSCWVIYPFEGNA